MDAGEISLLKSIELIKSVTVLPKMTDDENHIKNDINKIEAGINVLLFFKNLMLLSVLLLLLNFRFFKVNFKVKNIIIKMINKKIEVSWSKNGNKVNIIINNME